MSVFTTGILIPSFWTQVTHRKIGFCGVGFEEFDIAFNCTNRSSV
jgi:hypothetical protein